MAFIGEKRQWELQRGSLREYFRVTELFYGFSMVLDTTEVYATTTKFYCMQTKKKMLKASKL